MLTLIKLVLSGIPVYSFLLFWVCSSVCKCMEKFMRDFLCVGVSEGKGSHLINWEAVGCLVN